MKKLILTLLILTTFPVFAYGQGVNLNTYHASPFGVYEQLRLVPRTPIVGACEIGTMYVDNTTNSVRYCWDGVAYTYLSGVWKQGQSSQVFLTDFRNGAISVGIGDTVPQSDYVKLNISSPISPTTVLLHNSTIQGSAQVVLANQTGLAPPNDLEGFNLRYFSNAAGSQNKFDIIAFGNTPDAVVLRMERDTRDVSVGTELGRTFAKLAIHGSTDDDTLYALRLINTIPDPLSVGVNNIFAVRNDGHIGIGMGSTPAMVTIRDPAAHTNFATGEIGQVHITSDPPFVPGNVYKITMAGAAIATSMVNIGASFTTGPATSSLHFGTSYDDGAPGSGFHQVLNIDPVGNVGMGTFSDNPHTKLDVRGASVFNSVTPSINTVDPLGDWFSNSAYLLMGYSRSATHGEAAFITNRGGGGVGGFRFIDYTNANVENVLLTLQGEGLNNVGFGTTTPDRPISIRPQAGDSWLSFKNSTGTTMYSINNNNNGLNFAQGPNSRFLIQAGGNIGIGGITNPLERLEIAGTTVLNSFGSGGNIGAADLTFLNNSAKLLIGWNRSAGHGETSFINNGGPAGGANPGGFRFIDYANDNTETIIVSMLHNNPIDEARVGINNVPVPVDAMHVNGDVQYTGTLTQVSDERLKENMEVIKDPIKKLENIRGYHFNRIGSNKKEIGLSAQEVQESFPDIIHVIDEENGYIGVSYMNLIPVLIESVKELKSKNEKLRAENKEFKAEFEALHTAIERKNQTSRLQSGM